MMNSRVLAPLARHAVIHRAAIDATTATVPRGGRRRRSAVAVALAVSCLVGTISLGSPMKVGFAANPVWSPLPAAEVRTRMQSTALDRIPEAAQRETWSQRWDDPSRTGTPDQRLALAIATWGLVDPPLSTLVPRCESAVGPALAELIAEVTRTDRDPFMRANLIAYTGRTLAERRLFDEALELLKGVELPQAIDPAAVLFYRAVAAQGVLEIPTAMAALGELLQQSQGVPERYRSTATLMQAELKELDPKSLDEIARLMSDSERRLDLGRAGEQVQGVQDRIIADLDELIKKLEASGGGGGGGGGAGGNSNQPGGGAGDSVIKGATAPGETDAKKFSKEGQWGNLPEKQQTQAKNLINRNFPPHYREALERYFKKLATRPAAPNAP